MTQIEQARPGTHGLVFGQDTSVLHRHLPTAEFDHACAKGAVGIIERSTFRHKKLLVVSCQLQNKENLLLTGNWELFTFRHKKVVSSQLSVAEQRKPSSYWQLGTG